jgi:lysophospholipase L1-like esterase
MTPSTWIFRFVAVALVGVACSTGTRSTSTGDASGGKSSREVGGTGHSDTGASDAGGAGTGEAGFPSAVGGTAGTGGTTGCPAPINLGVRFVGRVDGCETDAVRFAWSGTGFVAGFNGTGLSVRLRGKPNQFTLLVDGVLSPTVVSQNGDQTYVLATGLAAGDHELALYRRTEASFGATSLLGITVESGQLGVPPPAPERLIEVVGDSISCGYGDEGTSPCTLSADTENHYLTYGALLARSCGAELSTVAYSGKGVARNYAGDLTDLLPQLYERAVPTEKRSVWRFLPQAQLVVVNLGTNDFSTNFDPTESEFVTAYQSLLGVIRSHYPNAYILCTVGPMLGGTDLTAKARPLIAAAVQARRTAGDVQVEAYELTTTNPNPGCDSHPNLSTHAAMADELATKVKAVLGW